MIEMVLPIPIKDKKAICEEDLAMKLKWRLSWRRFSYEVKVNAIHEEDLAMKLKSISKNIEQDLSKYLRGLKVVYSCKTSFPRVTSKIYKKMKHIDFQVLRKTNVKGNKFKL